MDCPLLLYLCPSLFRKAPFIQQPSTYNADAVAFQQPGNGTQLMPDVESALLQQVLQLTPEQLSSLPPEQQQQVIELQNMLSSGRCQLN